jgi:hypothetical protein
MPNEKPSILIYGAMPAPRSRSLPFAMAGSSRAIVDDAGLGSSRVSVETVAANLKAVIEQVGNLIWAAQQPAGELRVAHVTVNLAIGADGSVGLLGTAASTNATGTLTVRLQPRLDTQSPGQGRANRLDSQGTIASTMQPCDVDA